MPEVREPWWLKLFGVSRKTAPLKRIPCRCRGETHDWNCDYVL
jgi:hypothetical protein